MIGHPTYGGSGVIAAELARYLAAQGHEVHFFSHAYPVRLFSGRNNVFFHEVAPLDYPLFKYPPFELAFISRIIEVFQQHPLDLLHVHYAIPHAFIALSVRNILQAEGHRLPFVVTLHGTDSTLLGKDPSYHPVITHTLKAADHVTVVSEFLKEDCMRSFCLDREPAVIPNFVDLEVFRRRPTPDLRAQYAEEREMLLIHVSNFRPLKRVDWVLDTFHIVQQHIPARLLMIGDGPDLPRAEQLARRLNISDRVHFLGKMLDVVSCYAVADTFLLTSETESFGLAALEAMACEVPVAAFRVGGIPEVVIDRQTGWLAPLGDIEALARPIIEVWRHPDRLADMRQAARRRAADFDLRRIAPRYQEAYAQVLSSS